MTGTPWTRNEVITAFNLYCRIPFGRISKTNPQIKYLAQQLGRTPSAVGLKLSNFASFDPALQNRGIKGMKNAAKADKEIFNEFYANQEELAYESEKVLAQLEMQSLEHKYKKELPDLDLLVGEDRESYVKSRVNQNFFREMVLSNYQSTCAITGINIPTLLVASHIIPWASNKTERLNPENGLCLSALYDKAFDRGLITVDNNYKIVLSTSIKEYSTKEYYQDHFGNIENQTILLPQKYLPSTSFLDWHRENVFEKHM